MSSCRSKPHNSSAYDLDTPQPLHVSRICINPPHPTRFASRSPREWHAGRMLSTLPREWRAPRARARNYIKQRQRFAGRPKRFGRHANQPPSLRFWALRDLLTPPCCDLRTFASCSRSLAATFAPSRLAPVRLSVGRFRPRLPVGRFRPRLSVGPPLLLPNCCRPSAPLRTRCEPLSCKDVGAFVQGGHPICARCAFMLTTLHSQSASQCPLAHSGRARCAA